MLLVQSLTKKTTNMYGMEGCIPRLKIVVIQFNWVSFTIMYWHRGYILLDDKTNVAFSEISETRGQVWTFDILKGCSVVLHEASHHQVAQLVLVP